MVRGAGEGLHHRLVDERRQHRRRPRRGATGRSRRPARRRRGRTSRRRSTAGGTAAGPSGRAGRRTSRRGPSATGGAGRSPGSTRPAGRSGRRAVRRSRSATASGSGRRPARWRGGCRRGAGTARPRRRRSSSSATKSGLASVARRRNSATAGDAARVTRRRSSGDRQRRDLVDRLGGQAERLAAGGEDAHLRADPQQPLDETGDRVEHVLAVVEHEQRPAVAEEVEHRLRHRPALLRLHVELGGHGADDAVVVADPRQLHHLGAHAGVAPRSGRRPARRAASCRSRPVRAA